MFRMGKESRMVLVITLSFTILCTAHFLWRFGGENRFSVYTTRKAPETSTIEEVREEGDGLQALIPGEKININTAPAADLIRLPGIGEKKAQAIVAWREKNGPFRTIRQITKVSGIGEGLYRELKEHITVG